MHDHYELKEIRPYDIIATSSLLENNYNIETQS